MRSSGAFHRQHSLQRSLLSGGFQGHVDGEGGASPYFAIDRDLTTVSIDDLLYYSEPKPRAFLSTGWLVP